MDQYHADLAWLENPEVFAVNRLEAHSDHRFYESREEADEAVETVLSDEEQALYEEMRADDEERYGALSAQEIGGPETASKAGRESAPETETETSPKPETRPERSW